jgi:iron complex transport system ATP-binding protein
MKPIEMKGLSYSIGDKDLLKNICMHIDHGKMVALVGPNGSGKSTLLKNIYRVLKPTAGDIFIDGKDQGAYNHREMAMKMSVVSQEDIGSHFDFSVIEIVMTGRFAHKGLLDNHSDLDMEKALSALEKVDMRDFHDRSYLSLSGGEKQRVMIARAICQDASIMILDEPTNHLDIKHQLAIVSYIKELGITTFLAVHDINIAANVCDALMVLKAGELKYYGKPEEVLTKEVLSEVFDVDAYIVENKETNKRNILFY